MPPRASSVPKLPPPVTAATDEQAVLRQVVAYYHATLTQAPEARRYLAGRGLQSAELCAHFQLGYANRTLGYRLPQKNRRAGAALRGSLQRLGILRASGHEHFSGNTGRCHVVHVVVGSLPPGPVTPVWLRCRVAS